MDDDAAAMREELGDVLLQVVFHARVAAEGGTDRRFDVDDVAGDLVDKLVRRHPHVFGDAGPRDVAQVEAGWEEIKQAEKQRRSPTEGVSRSQPAASWGAALVRRAGRAGLPVPPAATLDDGSPEALGERLLAVVTAAERLGTRGGQLRRLRGGQPGPPGAPHQRGAPRGGRLGAGDTLGR